MSKATKQIIESTVSIGAGFTEGTSIVTHITAKLSNLLLLELERLLKSNSELNLASWRALRGLTHFENASQKELVQFANVDQGQMSRALTFLEKKGFVRSQRSTKDKRSWCFSITQAGLTYHSTLSPIVDNFHQNITEALTEEELATFVRLSAKVANCVTEHN